ncbi:MAG: lytic murein transglycosylase [Pseudomonadota bacterium]
MPRTHTSPRSRHRLRALAWCLLLGLAPACQANTLALPPAHPVTEFPVWLDGLRQEALARGVSSELLDAALGNAAPIPRVLELDQRQPEFTDTFLNYLDRRVTEERVETGRKLLRQHAALLKQVYRRYGIPPHVLVAFWGLETHYGTVLGSHPVPAALATLAWDTRRAAFFRAQLLDALDILQAGHIAPEAMKGSWAGAMGHLQFMPSTFQAYAVDGDGDGRKDLWNSLPDAFGSGAHYLHKLGWKNGESWGREVHLPEGFDWSQAALGLKKPLAAWRALGVTRADGKPLPRMKKMSGSILLPQGHAGPAFLVYDNFDAILTWNRSVNYALAVGLLADQLVGLPPLRNGRDADNRPIPREEAQALQAQLNQLGLYSGPLDGVLGSGTKAAIRAYQRQAGLPPDGYPSLSLLEHMRQVPVTPPTP